MLYVAQLLGPQFGPVLGFFYLWFMDSRITIIILPELLRNLRIFLVVKIIDHRSFSRTYYHHHTRSTAPHIFRTQPNDDVNAVDVDVLSLSELSAKNGECAGASDQVVIQPTVDFRSLLADCLLNGCHDTYNCTALSDWDTSLAYSIRQQYMHKLDASLQL